MVIDQGPLHASCMGVLESNAALDLQGLLKHLRVHLIASFIDCRLLIAQVEVFYRAHETGELCFVDDVQCSCTEQCTPDSVVRFAALVAPWFLTSEICDCDHETTGDDCTLALELSVRTSLLTSSGL